MLLNEGQPGMGGNIVQPTSRNPIGGRVGRLMSNLLSQAQRKEFMDYQHSLGMERDTHKEAAKAAGNIITRRGEQELVKEGVDWFRTDPNDPNGPKGPAPQSWRSGSTGYDAGSSYADKMKEIVEMKAKAAKEKAEAQRTAAEEKKNKNTPGNKGGKKKPKVGEPKERPGTFKDTNAAYKAGHIDAEQAAHISPTFARNLGKKAAVQEVKSTPAKPKQTKKTPNKVEKPKDSNSENSGNRVIWGKPQPNMPKGGKARGPKPPKPPKPPKAGM